MYLKNNKVAHLEASVRRKLINLILVLGSVYSIIGFFALAIRTWNYGFSFTLMVNFVLVCCLLLVTIRRKKIRTHKKALYIVGILFINFSIGFISIGPMAGSILLFPLSVFVVSMCFSQAWTYCYIASVSFFSMLVGTAFIFDYLTPKILMEDLIHSPSHWAGYIICMVMFFSITSYSLYKYRDATRRLMHELQVQRDYIQWQANHDDLTQLPTFKLMRELYYQALKRNQYTQYQVGLLFLDLNKFKEVNDTYGHDAGDHCLKVTAERLKTAVKHKGFASRVGGDEFIVVLEQVRGKEDIQAITQKIQTLVTEPIAYDGHHYTVGTSIGAAIAPEHGQDLEQVKKAADGAMYQAKVADQQQCVFASGTE
ncbi:GGDEF domain-containing protein [Vibrio sp. S9_S30]|uniref:GGDEF domain-containing protein n=1 Tax=Vibrio sp. S9_S30 TaxID=2720226 RepID=UPI0016817F00|nr:GGDEF domain-containing protein [Vibrio sp. S9_S30]MBD1556123.1 GGDEF domain-containing protein [Vibrio sp. S9_S30]